MRDKHLVWDLPLRLFHWLLVLTLSASWYCIENDLPEIHIQLGYVAIGLVTFRVLWGFIGTKHSLFKNFLPSPVKILAYLRGEINESAGHNPLGSIMVYLLLIFIACQAFSGLFIDDDIFSAGPYYGAMSNEFEKLMSTIHHQGFDILLVLVVLHIAAVFFYRWIKKIDLITPMVSGKKSVKDIKKGDEITHSKLIVALIAAVVCVFFVYWLVVINAPVIEEFY